MKKVLLVFLLLILVFLAIVAYQASTVPKLKKSTTIGASSLLKGFQLSPKSFSPGDFQSFFEQNNELGGNVVGWSGAITDLNRSSGAPETVMKLSKKYNYIPLVTIQVYDRKTGMLLSAFTEKKAEVIAFVARHKPQYFGIGIEMNLLYDKDKLEYSKFITILTEYISEIKKLSPETIIITSMQYEQLNGYRGGLFGGKNELSKTSWDAVSLLPEKVVLGLTTYPTLVFKDPNDIPEDYYSRTFNKMNRPILFTEIGWLDSNIIKGWESSPIEQKKFLSILAKQTDNDRNLGYIWSFMYPQSGAAAPFNQMSLNSSMNNELTEFWKSIGK